MSRKPVPADTQTAVLLRSRRRCCICLGLSYRNKFVVLDGAVPTG